MSVQPGAEGRDLPPEFVELVRSLFGADADQAIEAFVQAGLDPRALLDAAGLGSDPNAFKTMTAQVKRMMRPAPEGQVVNWELARDSARQAALAQGPDPSVAGAERAAVAEAFKVADLWLDQATALDPPGGAPQALSAADWIEATWPRWQAVTTPVARSMAQAMDQVLRQQAEEHPGAGELARGAARMLGGMTSGLFGMQLGHALGLLSREVFGYTDTGLPLGGRGAVALLPGAVAQFAAATELPPDEVRLFLAARESAHARLFAHVPWLADRLLGAVEAYAQGIAIDLERLERAVRELDPPSPQNIRQALSSGVFAPALSEPQKAALARLETALALVEGWVSAVAERALARHLPDVAALSEMTRRRRAAGGPAEHTMATLVGLELRPRRARQAGALWQAVTRQLGAAERDRLWSHPDLLPAAEDLDAPETFLERRAARAQADAEIDAEIAAFFDQQAPGGDASGV
ncbi:MAG: zinc-dependent metalloprotease [Bifidobacteriaceae bacterium]|jgi:putative hydrolase|nr:zinc-dependent metalloprotease [Bifidobacteriaceae bacterium]